MSKLITLCADDFAQNSDISNGILQLLRQCRLTATSCMTQSPLWPEFATELKPLHGHVDIGLHFNLTHSFGQNAVFKLPNLMFNRFTQAISEQQAYSELNSQLDLFEQHLGHAPDFIDGHQHVHQFSAIRTALLKTLQTRYPSKPPYVRLTMRNASQSYGIENFKCFIISQFGGKQLAANVARTSLNANRDFGGIYNLRPEADFAGMMQIWLKKIAAGGLIMCHPGLNSEDHSDPIRQARSKEFQYLCSDAFQAALQTANVELSRLIR